jgi:hypothetical protein
VRLFVVVCLPQSKTQSSRVVDLVEGSCEVICQIESCLVASTSFLLFVFCVFLPNHFLLRSYSHFVFPLIFEGREITLPRVLERWPILKSMPFNKRFVAVILLLCVHQDF